MSDNNKFMDRAVAKIRKDKYISEWYNLRPLLGNASWGCIFYIILASRQTGKGFCVQDYCLNQWKKNHNNYITWIRLREEHAKELLKNNAQKLFEPILVKRYGLNLKTRGSEVYHVIEEEYTTKKGEVKKREIERIKIAEVYGASTYYKTKGQTLYDADFFKDPKNQRLCVVDEFVAEAGESNFDRGYALVNLLETMFRNQKDRVKIFMLGNDVSDTSDLLSVFQFIPEQWGVYKLKSKKAVIDYVEPTGKYKEMRKGSIADILMGNNSTFTNERDIDKQLIDKRPLVNPLYIIAFSKDKEHWYTVWNNNIIKKYNKENKRILPMRPYLDEVYIMEQVKAVVDQFDTRSYHFRDLITFKLFQQDIKLLKPRT